MASTSIDWKEDNRVKQVDGTLRATLLADKSLNLKRKMRLKDALDDGGKILFVYDFTPIQKWNAVTGTMGELECAPITDVQFYLPSESPIAWVQSACEVVAAHLRCHFFQENAPNFCCSCDMNI